MARRLSDRTPELVIALLTAVLTAGALLLGGVGSTPGAAAHAGAAAPVTPAHVALIERRVEGLRGLRFRHAVPVAVVSPAQARREGIAEYDRSEPVGQQRASEELLKLLGLLPAGADQRRIEATVFGQQVAGYYDPRRKRLALVRGAGLDDVTLAHELTHALEDQHVDLSRLGSAGGDDEATAQQALVEGTATLVMEQYAARWPSQAPLGDALAGLTQATGGTPLPAYTMRTLIFPYLQGERFVRALRDADGGGWRLVDVAEAKRPPVTTAEILEPDRWLRAEQPRPVSLAVAPPRSAGWRRLADSTLGEEDLAALLAPQSGPLVARELTSGWRGGRYALWRRGALVDPHCAAPCRARDALLLAVRMGSRAEAGALAAAVGAWLRTGLHAHPADGGAAGLWLLPGGSAAVVRARGGQLRVALAPSAPRAQRLAGSG
ncbi:MAG TPA: hypothetical protein VFF79_18785 [Conexibacter sp.]|jgi:hypothetical protein|nr:hypothetical protein [Conexibacter sp.]